MLTRLFTLALSLLPPASSAVHGAVDDDGDGDAGGRRLASHRPLLSPGDLYVFSSSRVHETFDARGRDRVTLASFLSWNSWERDRGELLLWQ